MTHLIFLLLPAPIKLPKIGDLDLHERKSCLVIFFFSFDMRVELEKLKPTPVRRLKIQKCKLWSFGNSLLKVKPLQLPLSLNMPIR